MDLNYRNENENKNERIKYVVIMGMEKSLRLKNKVKEVLLFRKE